MTSNPTGWREMQRENPDYFGRNAQPEGYPEPVAVDPARRRQVGRAMGGVHQRAVTYLLRHTGEPGIALVHGSIDPGGAGERREHAWVELPGNVTFDGATGEFYATDAYLPAVVAVAGQRFSGEEAARLVLKSGHHGPWSVAELADAGVVSR